LQNKIREKRKKASFDAFFSMNESRLQSNERAYGFKLSFNKNLRFMNHLISSKLIYPNELLKLKYKF